MIISIAWIDMATQIYQNYTFLPTLIPGCRLWLDAADSTTVALNSGTTNVATWADKSGLGNNATAVGTIPYTAKINSVSAMNFPGTFSTYFAGSVANSGTTLTALSVFVMNTSSYATARILSLGKIGFGDFNNVLYTAAIERFYSNFDAFRDRSNKSAVIANFGVPVQVCSQFDGTNHTFYMNGTAGLPVASTGNFGYVNYDVGSSMNEENLVNLNGSIGEVILFNTSLSPTNRQLLEGYLAWKWGLQTNLPPDHPYKNNPPFMNTLSLPVTPTLPIPAQRNSVFSPNDITGLALWLDGQDPNANGQLPPPGFPVTVWKDKVAGKNAASGGTSLPLYVQNGGIFLNGSAYYTNTSFNYNLASRTIFLVFKVNVYNVAFGIFPFIPTPNSGTDYTSTSGLTIEQNVSGLRVYGNSGGYLAEIGGSSSVLLSPHIYYETMNGTSGSTLFDGGSSNATSASYTAGTASGYGIGTRWLSGAPSLANSTNGIFYEILLYSSPLTTSQRQQVEGYLAWKWGLQANLPTTHLYYKSPFPNVSYAPIPSQPPRITSGIWQPNQFTGLALWLDAADTSTIQTSGTTVIGVTDKSPTPKTLTITNTVSYISKQAIVFTNTNGRFNVSGMPSAPYDILTVATANSVTNIFRTLLRTLNTSNPFLLNINTNDLGIWDGVGFRQFGSLTMTPNEKALVYASMASNNTMQASKNGTVSLTSPTPPANESAIAFIGNNTGSGGQPWGTLQEIVIYSTTLTTKQRQQVEGYLAWKWNLQNSLPGDHPYKLFPPAP